MFPSLSLSPCLAHASLLHPPLTVGLTPRHHHLSASFWPSVDDLKMCIGVNPVGSAPRVPPVDVLVAAWVALNKQLGLMLPYGMPPLLHTLARVTDPASVIVDWDSKRHTTLMGIPVCMRLAQEMETLLGTPLIPFFPCTRSSFCTSLTTHWPSLPPPHCLFCRRAEHVHYHWAYATSRHALAPRGRAEGGVGRAEQIAGIDAGAFQTPLCVANR